MVVACEIASGLPAFTNEEVAFHASPDDCWVIIRGCVYDVTGFLPKHPGGPKALSRPGRAGKDVTEPFLQVGHSSAAELKLKTLRVGTLIAPELQIQGKCRSQAAFESDIAGSASTRCSTDVHNSDAEEDASEEHTILIRSQVMPKAGSETSKCFDWHASRRAQILEHHPQVTSLLSPNPWTLLLIPTLMVAHCCGCLLAIRMGNWINTFALAYSLGALCKMWQFAMAHEVCHGNVTESLDTHPRCKCLVLHLSALPAVGSQIFDYYLFIHLGHHAVFGNHPDEKIEFCLGALEDKFDGDLISTHVIRMFFNKILHVEVKGDSPSFKKTMGLFTKGLHRPPYFKLLMFDVIFHIWHLSAILFFAFGVGLCFLPWLLARVLHPDFLRKQLHTATKGASAQEVDEIMCQLGHMTFHPCLCAIICFVLFHIGGDMPLQEGSRGMWRHGMAYLLLSEMCYTGFLHPYWAFWIGTHCTGSGMFGQSSYDADQTSAHRQEDNHRTVASPIGRPAKNVGLQSQQIDRRAGQSEDGVLVYKGSKTGGYRFCQPTMSTYSWCSAWMSANLTLHVEHHDFPNCPWNRLPQVRQCAPEFYKGLRQSTGFLHTWQEYLRNGDQWGYGCVSDTPVHRFNQQRPNPNFEGV